MNALGPLVTLITKPTLINVLQQVPQNLWIINMVQNTHSRNSLVYVSYPMVLAQVKVHTWIAQYTLSCDYPDMYKYMHTGNTNMTQCITQLHRKKEKDASLECTCKHWRTCMQQMQCTPPRGHMHTHAFPLQHIQAHAQKCIWLWKYVHTQNMHIEYAKNVHVGAGAHMHIHRNGCTHKEWCISFQLPLVSLLRDFLHEFTIL